MTRRLEAHGLSVVLPAGWEGRIYCRSALDGETTHPILHAATVPLPHERGDYGAGAVELLGPDDAFVSLIEFHPDAAATPLFASRSLPRLVRARRFDPLMLQRTRPGQAGFQTFGSRGGRAFCLYVVLGADGRRDTLVPRVNALLRTVDVEARSLT